MRDDGRGAKFKIAKRLQFEEQDWERNERERERAQAIIEAKERETRIYQKKTGKERKMKAIPD